MRALRWTHIAAPDPAIGKWRPVTEAGWSHDRFAIHVWRSVRAVGDTKTRKSRRTLGLPKRCVRVLREHQERQAAEQARAGAQWQDRELVFTTVTGGQLETPGGPSHAPVGTVPPPTSPHAPGTSSQHHRCTQCRKSAAPVGTQSAAQHTLAPGRIRRGFRNIRRDLGTPARVAKPSRPGPGRPKGSSKGPATRYLLPGEADMPRTTDTTLTSQKVKT